MIPINSNIKFRRLINNLRCMYGSNWPVCRIPRSEHGATAEFDDTIADFKKLVAECSPMERQAMAAGNAKRFYGLKDV